MAFNPGRFAQLSAFERYVLDAIAPSLEMTTGLLVVDFRDEDRTSPRVHALPGGMPARAVAYVNGASARELDVTPIVFGSAWKILDLVADEILGRKANGDPMTIEAKCKTAATGNGFARHKPFLNEVDLWKRYMHLYADTLPLRHSLVHRELIVHADGRVESSPVQGNPVRPTTMDRDELGYFFRAVQGFARALISGDLPRRERDNLAFILSHLNGVHGLGTLPGRAVSQAVLVLARPEVLPSGAMQYDARAALSYVHGQWPNAGVDLLLKLPDGTVLRGHLEDAPEADPAPIRINPPPRWLEVAPPENWTRWDRLGSP
ncbi:hypothetical protein ACWDRB_55190 [Nonomuraea sp. NPDC003707]